MAGVNGVEIKVGQVWRTRGGALATVESFDDHPAYPVNIKVEGDSASCGRNGRCWGDINAEYTSDDDDDLIELIHDENGFTTWRGGEQPVPDDTMVTTRFNDGSGSTTRAGSYDWRDTNLVAYKVVEQAAAPQLADSATLAEETLSALGWRFDGQAWVEQPTIGVAVPTPMMKEPGYELLAYVLERAYNQAALGKGKERHANGEPFDEQVMQDGARRFGVGALLFQAFKKSEESQRLPLDRGVNELLGAIVYLAGAVIRREADAQEGGE